MVGHGGSSAGSYIADLTSPIPSHCASIVMTSTLRVNHAHAWVNGLTLTVLGATIDAQWEGMWGCRVGEVRAGTTSPMPDHKGFMLQKLVNFQKFSTLWVKCSRTCMQSTLSGGLHNARLLHEHSLSYNIGQRSLYPPGNHHPSHFWKCRVIRYSVLGG